ncbi:hypothetical protein, partial [Nocardia pseudovaccinii]|uniref:hypothetical protein n=1 Tax=Nocardia pseudovaccinii TaxID=189540 RepID=UPI000B213E6F
MTISLDAVPAWSGGGVPAMCLRCKTTVTLRIPRFDKVSFYRCPECGSWLYSHKLGPNRGRYLCPIRRAPVTLGQTGIQLDRDYLLEFRAGVIARGTDFEELVTTPDAWDQALLDRFAGRVFGAGCVVDRDFDPHLYNHLPPDERERRLRPGPRLVPAGDGAAGEPIVNARLKLGSCAACGGRVVELPEHRVATEWTPLRTVVFRKRRRGAA